MMQPRQSKLNRLTRSANKLPKAVLKVTLLIAMSLAFLRQALEEQPHTSFKKSQRI